MKYNKSGFTLIEITIALLVLGIGLLGILALFPVGIDASGRAINMTKATFLAQEDIEEAKRLGLNDIVDIPAGTQALAPYTSFDHQLTQTDIVAGELIQVDVVVSWPQGAATQQSITLTTYIANYEP